MPQFFKDLMILFGPPPQYEHPIIKELERARSELSVMIAQYNEEVRREEEVGMYFSHGNGD